MPPGTSVLSLTSSHTTHTRPLPLKSVHVRHPLRKHASRWIGARQKGGSGRLKPAASKPCNVLLAGTGWIRGAAAAAFDSVLSWTASSSSERVPKHRAEGVGDGRRARRLWRAVDGLSVHAAPQLIATGCNEQPSCPSLVVTIAATTPASTRSWANESGDA